MPLLAATATHAGHAGLWLALVAATVLWAVGYVIACVIWPFTNCRKCTGSGKRRSPSGRAWRRCPRCKGTGARLRAGRRLYNSLRRLSQDSA